MHSREIIEAIQRDHHMQYELANRLVRSNSIMKTIGEMLAPEGRTGPEANLGRALLAAVLQNELTLANFEDYQGVNYGE